MEQSILKSTKKLLGIGPDDESFDLDITTHINTAFSTLSDLGVGPSGGFVIDSDTEVWADFLTGAPFDPEDPDNKIKLSKVKTCIFLQTRLLFDPPTVSFLLDSMQRQLEEQKWRLNVNREAYAWTDPFPIAEPSGVGFDTAGFGLGGFGL